MHIHIIHAHAHTRAPTKKMWKSLKAASCRRTKSERGIFTQKTMATSWSREISNRSAKTRCKILSSARRCSLLAVCVNLSCLFKNTLGLIFFRRLVFFCGFWNFIFAEIRENAGKWEPWHTHFCAHTCTFVRACTHTHTHTRTQAQTDARAHTHACTHTCMHTYTHTTHTHR